MFINIAGRDTCKQKADGDQHLLLMSFAHPKEYTIREDLKFINCDALTKDSSAFNLKAQLIKDTLSALLLNDNSTDRLILTVYRNSRRNDKKKQEESDEEDEVIKTIRVGTPLGIAISKLRAEKWASILWERVNQIGPSPSIPPAAQTAQINKPAVTPAAPVKKRHRYFLNDKVREGELKLKECEGKATTECVQYFGQSRNLQFHAEPLSGHGKHRGFSPMKEPPYGNMLASLVSLDQLEVPTRLAQRSTLSAKIVGNQ